MRKKQSTCYPMQQEIEKACSIINILLKDMREG